MLIAALGIGLLTAYYFGVQAGIWAAAVAAALVVATMVPGLSLYAYAVLAVGVGAIAYFGPKLRRPNSAASAMKLARGFAMRYLDLVRGGKKDRGNERGTRGKGPRRGAR